MNSPPPTVDYAAPSTPPAWQANPWIAGTVGGVLHCVVFLVLGFSYFARSMRQIDGVPLGFVGHAMKVIVVVLGFPITDLLFWIRPRFQAPTWWMITLSNSVLWGICIGLLVHWWHRRRQRKVRPHATA